MHIKLCTSVLHHSISSLYLTDVASPHRSYNTVRYRVQIDIRDTLSVWESNCATADAVTAQPFDEMEVNIGVGLSSDAVTLRVEAIRFSDISRYNTEYEYDDQSVSRL